MAHVVSRIGSLRSTWYYRGILNASYLALGNIINQIISFVGFIYIARILGPDKYGVYVTVGAFVGIFEFLLFNGLNKALIREGSKNLKDMKTHLENYVGFRNVLILLAIILCIISSFFTSYEVQTKLFILIFSLDLAYKGLRGFLGTIYQASEQMHYISCINILNTTLFVALAILFLLLGFSLFALFLIALLVHFITIAVDFFVTRRIISFNFFSRLHIEKKLLKPAIIFSLLGFLGFFVTRIDLIMISWLGTSTDVGIYGVAYKIAQQGGMLRNVNVMAFFPIFVKLFQQQKIPGIKLLKYSGFFVITIFILAFILSFFVKKIILLIFGLDYQKSGDVLRILIFYIALTWSTLPFSAAAQATDNEQYLLIPLIFMGLTNIPLNYILFKKFGVIGIAYSTLIVYIIGSMLYITITWMVMKKQGYLI